MSEKEDKKNNDKSGHRDRLKKRYLSSGFSGFSDHEVLELIYFYALPRRDTKPLAKKLLTKFGSLKNIFEATPDELMKIGGLSENSAILFSLMMETYRVYVSTKDVRIELKTPTSVHRYLKQFFVNEKRECFYLVCLDNKKRLINTYLISEGSIDETQVYIRNIFEEAIKSNAVNVILAHNHPSGDPTPSNQDIIATDNIVKSLEIVSVRVLDHVIITDDDYYSFLKNKILKYS